MARVTVGMVFHAEVDKADDIVNEIRGISGMELIHIQQSYGKLWIKKVELR